MHLNPFSHRHNRFRRSNKSQVSGIYFPLLMVGSLILAPGCTRSPHPVMQPTQTPIASPGASALPIPTSPTNTPSSPGLCKDLKQIAELELDERFRRSHIIYIADPIGAASSQIWVVSMEDGSERLLFNHVGGLALGFLPDGYHFIVYGTTIRESDLDGTPFRKVDDSEDRE